MKDEFYIGWKSRRHQGLPRQLARSGLPCCCCQGSLGVHSQSRSV